MSYKDSILAAPSRTIEKIHVPKWGFDVLIRSMNARDRTELAAWQKEHDATLDFFGKLLVMSLCDDDGLLLFDDSHIPQLCEKDFASLEHIVNAIFKLNGLEAHAIEDAKKK